MSARPTSYVIDDARHLTDAARTRGAQPRVHPNGFIQLDLKLPASDQHGHSGGDLRLHIWNPLGMDLPRQGTVNQVHDHVFDMHSTVVRGVLIQRLYRFVTGDRLKRTHELYRAVYDKRSSSRLEPIGVEGRLALYDEFGIYAGASYSQPAFTLHDSIPDDMQDGGLVITLMEKKDVHEGTPTVVCPIGQPPDNDFDRSTAAPQDLLWEAIEMSLS